MKDLSMEKRIKTLGGYAEIIKKKTKFENLFVITLISAFLDSWKKNNDEDLDDYYLDIIGRLIANLE